MGILSAKAENNSAHHQQMSDFEAAEIVYLSPPNRRFREGDTMNLRSVLLATAMASGMCSYAMAADMPLKAPPPPAPVEVYSWTSFYLGGNLGGEWSRYHSTITSGNGSVRASDSPHYHKYSCRSIPLRPGNCKSVIRQRVFFTSSEFKKSSADPNPRAVYPNELRRSTVEFLTNGLSSTTETMLQII